MFEPGSPAQLLEQRIDWLTTELDELCDMATKPETMALIEGQRKSIGTMAHRAGTLLQLMLARHPQSFRKYHAA